MTAPKLKPAIAAIVLAGSAAMMFARLGHAALWDDEANTALFALSVWRTGDTSALLEHNLIAHYSGGELVNLRNRYVSPLGYYLAAPFVGLGGRSAFAARLPFAVCGLLTVALMLRWLHKDGASLGTWLLMAAGILGNVSLMLYARQCRYFSPAILTTLLLAYLYFHRSGGKRTLAAMAAVSLLLLAANYLCFAAAYACLLVDYLLWGRRERRLSWSDAAVLLLPQLVLGGALLCVYNPLGKDIWQYHSENWWLDRATLLWWNLRDLNGCEMGVGVLIAAAPLLYFATRDRRLLRAPAAIATYVVAATLGASHPMDRLFVGDMRYLCPLIPLCILTAALSIRALTARIRRLAVPLALLAFGTNILHGGPLAGMDRMTVFSRPIAVGRFRSTVCEFVRELAAPSPSAYRAAADWIDRNVPDGQNVWAMPSYMTYPLMFHAPRALYAWQIDYPPADQFRHLPLIHISGRIPPDYIVVFGPVIQNLREIMGQWQSLGIRYEQVATLDFY